MRGFSSVDRVSSAYGAHEAQEGDDRRASGSAQLRERGQASGVAEGGQPKLGRGLIERQPCGPRSDAASAQLPMGRCGQAQGDGRAALPLTDWRPFPGEESSAGAGESRGFRRALSWRPNSSRSPNRRARMRSDVSGAMKNHSEGQPGSVGGVGEAQASALGTDALARCSEIDAELNRAVRCRVARRLERSGCARPIGRRRPAS